MRCCPGGKRHIAAASMAAIACLMSVLAWPAVASADPLPDAVLAVSGESAYEFDLSLQNITRSYPAFRSTGSAGCNATADWIMAQMSAFGLQTHSESYGFPSWDLRSVPELKVAADGDLNGPQTMTLASFASEQWSYSTGASRNGTIAVLPLPPAADRGEIGIHPIDLSEWDKIDITGRIVLIGKEVRWAATWEQTFVAKLRAQPPLAVISAYSYNWMSGIDEVQLGSAAGRPLSLFGPYLEDLHIPSGTLNYSQAQMLRAMAGGTAMASMRVDSFSFNGDHLNVIGIIPGSNSTRKLLVTAHYDSVTTNGFADNGAGIAGLLEMGRVLSAAYRNGSYVPVPDIVFVAFDSEEIGLVGSLAYVSAHQEEMQNVVAVLNLDCIGNRDLTVTPTENSPADDARMAIVAAAGRLSVPVSEEPPGGSDQESFLHPDTIRSNTQQRWGIVIGSGGMSGTGNAILLISHPIYNTDVWSGNQSGWIHTRNDRSGVPDWVSPVHLGEHIAVATLAVMSISSGDTATAPGQDWTPAMIAIFAAIAIAAIAVLILRSRRAV